MGNITSANAVLAFTIAGLYTSAVRIQGFATDDAFDIPEVEPNEFMLGVDGKLSAGAVPIAFDQEVSLQADSVSNQFFDNWFAAERAQGYPYVASGTIIVPGLALQYNLTNGYLRRYKPMAGAKKVLQPRKYGLHWQSLTPAAYAGL